MDSMNQLGKTTKNIELSKGPGIFIWIFVKIKPPYGPVFVLESIHVPAQGVQRPELRRPFKHGGFLRPFYGVFTSLLRAFYGLFTGCLRPLTKGLSYSGRGSSGQVAKSNFGPFRHRVLTLPQPFGCSKIIGNLKMGQHGPKKPVGIP